MNVYTVNLNGKGTTYVKLKDIPFQMDEKQVEELHKNSLVRFFSNNGEITILLSKNNEEIYHEVYNNPEPLNEDGYVKILQYNKDGKLNSPKKNIPSVIDTLNNKKSYHKNGQIKNPVTKEIFEDDYGEYTLLNNISKELKEVRCYSDGFRQYIQANGSIEWFLKNKLHSPNKETPANIVHYNNGSICIEKYYINGKRHREDGPAVIEYYNNEDGSIRFQQYYLNGELQTQYLNS
jgi:hypothetical protein